MARGELSYSKARALTRVATAENEAEWLELARHATAAHVEKLARAWRRVDRLESAEVEAERHQSRYLRLHPDDDGSWVIRGRLDPEVGAVLEKALEWAREALYRRDAAVDGDADVESAGPDGAEQRRADAVGLVAERALAVLATDAGGAEAEAPSEEGGHQPPRPVGRADRFQVMVHMEANQRLDATETFPRKRPGREGRPETQPKTSPRKRGIPETTGVAEGTFSRETARRLACDADLVVMAHDTDGRVLDVGRKRRTVPPALRRALEHRDGGCRFPGCGCRYTDAHHVKHWSEGGETKLDNLVELCRRHHRAVHEEGFRVEVAREGRGWQVRFYRPDGRPIPEVPAAPVRPPDPVGAMIRAHQRDAVEPDAWTATPDWHGEPLDYGLAIDMLRGVRGARDHR